MMQIVIFSRLSHAVCNYKLFCKRSCLASWFVELAVYFLLFATTTNLFSSDGTEREISTASALRIRGAAVKEDEAETSRLSCRPSAQPARHACVRFVRRRPAPPRWHLTAMRTSPAASGSAASTSRGTSSSGKSKLLYGDRLPVAYEESERRYGHDSSVAPALHAPAVITTTMTGGCTRSAGAGAPAGSSSDVRDDHRPGTSTPAPPLDATADGPGPIPAEVFRRYLWTDMVLEKRKLFPATRSSAQRPRKELPPTGKDEMQEDTAAVKIPLKFHYNDGRESQEGGVASVCSTLRTDRQEEHGGGKEDQGVPAGHTQEPIPTSASTTAVRPRSKNLHDARAARITAVAPAKPIKPIYAETVVMQQKLPKLPEPLDQLDDETPFSFANLQKRNSSTSLLPPIIPPRSTTLGGDDLTVGITQSDLQGSALPNLHNGCSSNFDGTTLHKVYVYNNLTANLNDCEFVPFQSVFLAKDFDRLADDERCEELCNRGKNVDAKGTANLQMNLQEDPRLAGDERDSQTVGPRTSSGEDRLSKSQGCAAALLQSAGIKDSTDVEMSSLFFPEHEATPYSFFNATTLFAATAGEDEELPPDHSCTAWTVPTSVQSLPASPTTGPAGATRHRAADHLRTLSPWTATSCLAGVLLLSSASPPIINRNLETSHVMSLAGSSSSSTTPLKTNARPGVVDGSCTGATGTRATCSSCSGPPGRDGFCRRSTMVKNHVFCCSKGEKSSPTSSRRCRSSPGLLERRKVETPREEEGVSCTQTPTVALLPLASGTAGPCDEEDMVVDENSPPPEDCVEHQDESSSWPVSAAIGDFFSDFATSIADTLFGNHERRLEEAKREGEFVKGGNLDSSEIALFLHTIASSAAYRKRISKFSSKVDGWCTRRTEEGANSKAKAAQQEDADRRYDEQLQEELYAFTEYLAKKPIFGTRQVTPDARADSWGRPRDTIKDKRIMTNKSGSAGRTSAGLFVEKNAGTKSRSSSEDDEDKIADEASILYRAMYKMERRLWITNVGRAMKEIAKYRRNSKWILSRDEEGANLHHDHESQGTSPYIIDRPSNPTVLDDYEFALQQIGTREFREGNALTQYVYKQEPGRWQAGMCDFRSR